MRRLWAAAESAALGRGGISLVARASGVSRRAISVGLAELKQPPEEGGRRQVPIRRPGGGRKKTQAKDPALLRDLEKLVEPGTRGDPESPLRWTCKSVRRLAEELRRRGHQVSHTLVAELLQLNYSLQGNRKTREGSSHPDRNAQFEHIMPRSNSSSSLSRPSRWTPRRRNWWGITKTAAAMEAEGAPGAVQAHDFGKQKDVPYGVYDLGRDAGWVSVGTDRHRRVRRRKHQAMVAHDGPGVLPRGPQLLITADGGGSNGSRVRLWKLELQKLADETGLASRSATFRPGPASGTRSNIVCSHSLLRTGEANRW